VDTPRAENQFGSLVVCLPCAHTGGELAVRHAGREVKFDWSGDSKELQWAAFYSDCEHEVLPVTSGYRVTLTYNLYYNKFGNQIPAQVNWKVSSLPLYEVFSEVLRDKSFMPYGNSLFFSNR
jgi:2OG-Fe(II) oxygenase superfamily